MFNFFAISFSIHAVALIHKLEIPKFVALNNIFSTQAPIDCTIEIDSSLTSLLNIHKSTGASKIASAVLINASLLFSRPFSLNLVDILFFISLFLITANVHGCLLLVDGAKVPSYKIFSISLSFISSDK